MNEYKTLLINSELESLLTVKMVEFQYLDGFYLKTFKCYLRNHRDLFFQGSGGGWEMTLHR